MKNFSLEKGTTAIVWYPLKEEKVNGEEIWREKRSSEIEIGLYVHIPFCIHICPFCPFVKFLWDENKERAYIRALKKEIDLYSRLPILNEKKIIALYFGGGTPTTLTTASFIELIHHIEEKFPLAQNAEVAVEAHPLTVSSEKLLRLLEAGVNRLSIGIQSFNNRLLKILNCPHEAKNGIKSLIIAKDTGFRNIGIDLLYGIPTQKLNEWQSDIKIPVEYKIDHVSIYNLGIFPGTSFYEAMKIGEIPNKPSYTLIEKMYFGAKEHLENHGYKPYTVANFAKRGKECVYNKIVLEAPQKEYIGLGVGAIEYINGYLTVKQTSLEEYIKIVENNSIPYMNGGYVSREEQMAQYMAVGIGCLKISKKGFREKFDIDIDLVYGGIIQKLKKHDLIDEDENTIFLTKKGIRYLTSISKIFFVGGKGIHQGEVVK